MKTIQGRSFHFSERQDTQSLLCRYEHELLLRVWATLHCIALKSLRDCNFDDVVNWYVFIIGSIFDDDCTWFREVSKRSASWIQEIPSE
jgi:hypothetical protein